MRRRKHMNLHRAVVSLSPRLHQRLSMNFVYDQLFDGCRFRILTVIDQWSPESVIGSRVFQFR